MSQKTPPPPPPRATTSESAPHPAPVDAEQTRLRAMYELLFDNNPDAIYFSDSQGNLYLNKAAQEMSRVPQTEEQSGVENWTQKFGIFLSDCKTPHPTETLPMTIALVQRQSVREYEFFVKTEVIPEGMWISCSADPLPNGQAIAVCRNITARKQLEADLAQRNAELAEQLRENNSLIERLRLAVDELSTPVLELADDILALPVVGIVDTVRSSRMMEKILAEVVSRRCRAVIMDVTGVDVIDTSTADRFIRIARSIELLGAECVISGVQPAVAQTLTDLGVSFRGLTMQRNLKRALDLCVARLQQSRRANPA